MAVTQHFVLISPAEYGGLEHFAFTYHADSQLAPGTLVNVPLGHRSSLGVVLGPAEKPSFATKGVISVLEYPALPSHSLELARWLAEYYASSAQAVWQTLLPAGLSAKARALRKPPVSPLELPGMDMALTADQQKAIAAISGGSQTSYLLHGVTGSGKTQIYIELAKEAVAAGRSVVILVPEIALTPQIEARFRAHFEDLLIASHSQMTPAARRGAWIRALTAKGPQVVIGPRSSLFLPLKKIGLIVVDECHETTYKQEQNPRYTADAVAARLAHLAKAKLVLGSATPSASQYFLVRHSRLALVELPARVNLQELPSPQIIDLREKELLRQSRFISRPLLDALSETLADGRQSILFINRRGSASSQLCADCGFVFKCPDCHLPLTFHADAARLICHYCNYQAMPAAVCPECSSSNLRFVGGGTKRIEAEITKLLPKARLARLDRDSSTPEYLHQVYRELHDGQLDILIGTQMIAKGWDLPNVDTVGIVSADTMLHLPDYAAAERTFQLISQVSGRAGRGDRAGRVLIQTFTPDHPAIKYAASGDYAGFVRDELAARQLLGYPPYAYLLKLTYAAKQQETAQKRAQELLDKLSLNSELRLLGPAPAFREQAAGRFFWQIIVKAAKRAPLVETARSLPSGWTADPDPINLL